MLAQCFTSPGQNPGEPLVSLGIRCGQLHTLIIIFNKLGPGRSRFNCCDIQQFN